MKLSRIRFTVRSLMVAVAVVSLLLGWGADRVRRGYPLVEFHYTRLVANEPLVNPVNVLAVDSHVFRLEDGREVRIESGPLCEGMGFLKEGPDPQETVVDLEINSDRSVTVHALSPAWSCGNCAGIGRRFLPVRIPLIPRTVYGNHRTLIGTGRFVALSALLDLETDEL